VPEGQRAPERQHAQMALRSADSILLSRTSTLAPPAGPQTAVIGLADEHHCTAAITPSADYQPSFVQRVPPV
jgi:hypothetical protein